MTVQELIQQLETLPPDTKVVVRGYEDGYNDILQLKLVKIKSNENAHWYEGEYDDSNDEADIDAVNLFGHNKNPKDDL